PPAARMHRRRAGARNAGGTAHRRVAPVGVVLACVEDRRRGAGAALVARAAESLARARTAAAIRPGVVARLTRAPSRSTRIWPAACYSDGDDRKFSFFALLCNFLYIARTIKERTRTHASPHRSCQHHRPAAHRPGAAA